jgi:hypothetical protein
MAVAEDEMSSRGRAQPRDHAIGAGADLFDRLTARATVAKKRPAGVLAADLDRSQSFVIAIIPFHQVRVDDDVLDEACEFARATSSLQGTCEYDREVDATQPFAQAERIRFTPFRQRDVGAPGVLV